MITDLSKLLFIDVETAPTHAEFTNMDMIGQKLYLKKFAHEIEELKGNATPWESLTEMQMMAIRSHYYSRAAIHPEFARVVCVSIGFVRLNADGEPTVKVKTMISNSEAKVLEELRAMIVPAPPIDPKVPARELFLVAHNGKEFDFPFLAKRYLINRLTVPPSLQTSGKKPWDIPHIDTMEFWRFGSFKGSISLDLFCWTLGIESPKQDMDGSAVAKMFYGGPGPGQLPFEDEEKRFQAISAYCEGDIIALARVYLRLINIEKPIKHILR